MNLSHADRRSKEGSEKKRHFEKKRDDQPSKVWEMLHEQEADHHSLQGHITGGSAIPESRSPEKENSFATRSNKESNHRTERQIKATTPKRRSNTNGPEKRKNREQD